MTKPERHYRKMCGLILICAFFLASCIAPFNPEGNNMGTITIGGASRNVVTDAEAATDLFYVITLTGPGGTISREIPAGSPLRFSAKVILGTWNVQVKAYDDLTGVLRAINTTTTVTVKARQDTQAIIDMITATEVTGWTGLAGLAAAIGTSPAAVADREELIIVKGNAPISVALPATGDSIIIQRKITIVGEGPQTFIRSAEGYPFFNVVAGGVLTLGEGIVLDGDNLSGSGNSSLINVVSSTPSQYATLILDGATLSDNNETTTAAPYDAGGGAVYLDGYAAFEMKNGFITGKKALNGGGVGLDSSSGATFTMSGGSITGNTAINNGGGVYIVSSSGGTFTMSGGSITSNDANTGFSGYVGDNLYIEHGNLDHIDWTAADIGGLYAGGLAKYGAVLKGWNSASDWSGTYYDARPGSGTCYPVWSGDPGFMWFDPIAITSLSELEEIGTYSATLGYDYILVNNITLGSTWTAIGDGTDPFTGNLDGRGHTITVPSGGTTITPQSAGLYDVAGLFGNINDPSALITDLTLAGGAFTAVPGSAGVVMGGIVGWMSDGTIQNCAVRININQNSPNAASGEIGGIAGYSAGIIQNCYSSGAIDVILPSSASSEIVWVGGIAGGNDGTIENCYSTGNISGSSYETSAGGIAGWHSSSVISYCYATGNVTGYSPGSTAGYYGGIVGQAVTTTMGIGNCVALNGNIATTDTIPNLGRVCGDSTFFPLADNYGCDDMQVNNTTGSWTSNATGIDGGDVSMGTAPTEANTELWWRTLGPGPDWSFSAAGAGTPANPWEWGGNLPKLYWE